MLACLAVYVLRFTSVIVVELCQNPNHAQNNSLEIPKYLAQKASDNNSVPLNVFSEGIHPLREHRLVLYSFVWHNIKLSRNVNYS